jgi:hypothetical protein
VVVPALCSLPGTLTFLTGHPASRNCRPAASWKLTFRQSAALEGTKRRQNWISLPRLSMAFALVSGRSGVFDHVEMGLVTRLEQPMTFQIHALPKTAFEDLFGLTDAELKNRGMLRVIADSEPGYPCRVSLQDAKVGEELILMNYQNLDGNTPYAASHAIYVRKNATQAQMMPGQIPEVLSRRLLSVRGFNRQKLLVEADVTCGQDLAMKLKALFSNVDVDFVHVHNAKQGCFAAKVTRQ